MASVHGDLRHLLPTNYKALIAAWLEEDCPSFDYAGFVVGDVPSEARLLGKSAVSIQHHAALGSSGIPRCIKQLSRAWSPAFPSSTRFSRS